MPIQISPAEVVLCFSHLVEQFPPEVDRTLPESALCAALTRDYPESDSLSAVGRAVESGLLVRNPGNLLRHQPAAKIPVGGRAVVNAYRVMAEAVKWGVKAGYRRAYKYTDNPEDDRFQQCLVDSIMSNLSEQFSFDEEQE